MLTMEKTLEIIAKHCNMRQEVELAAKACRLPHVWDDLHSGMTHREYYGSWNPLIDNDQCAQLEAHLMVNIRWKTKSVTALYPFYKPYELEYSLCDNDRQLARRIAVVMTVAGMQREKEQSMSYMLDREL